MKQVLFILLSIAYPILGYAQFEGISYKDKYRLDFDISRKDSTTSSFVRNSAYLQIGCMAYMNKEHNMKRCSLYLHLCLPHSGALLETGSCFRMCRERREVRYHWR